MLTSLSIQNYAIIESLDITFSKGLSIITGETGAGKSILLGAMGLIMGKRADTKSLLNDEKKCIVEAHFSAKSKSLKAFFDKHDLDYDDELIIRREIAPSGKSRAFINDTPTNLKTLLELTSKLIDMHQQFDNLSIHTDTFQLDLIDALANNGRKRSEYLSVYEDYKKNKQELKELNERNSSASKESDFISFQLKELQEANLVSEEQEKWEEELKMNQSSEDIKGAINMATSLLLDNENSVLNQLKTLSNALDPYKTMNEDLKRVHNQINNSVYELEDAATTCGDKTDEFEFDPKRISELEYRLDLIYRLQNKHHVKSVAELINIQQNFAVQLGGFGDLSEAILAKEKEIEKQTAKLEKISVELSKKRKTEAPKFEKKVIKLLGELGMQNAAIQVDIQKADNLTATGQDKIEFLFKANKGGKFLPLKDVASGGELSRLNLCTKSIVAGNMDLPTLIFDEIDTGISGDVALKMGAIIKKLSNKHQVITITHSPQVASHADTHLFVYKIDEDGKTKTNVRLLTEKERIKELATMLSKKPPSESALGNARELLGM